MEVLRLNFYGILKVFAAAIRAMEVFLIRDADYNGRNKSLFH